jgi:hypothetical protein
VVRNRVEIRFEGRSAACAKMQLYYRSRSSDTSRICTDATTLSSSIHWNLSMLMVKPCEPSITIWLPRQLQASDLRPQMEAVSSRAALLFAERVEPRGECRRCPHGAYHACLAGSGMHRHVLSIQRTTPPTPGDPLPSVDRAWIGRYNLL